MKLIMLGTGNAAVTKCYNTCFLLSEDNEYFLVDGGGGNGLLQQLETIHLDYRFIHTIFITHKHIDHLLGLFWLLRMVLSQCVSNHYDGELTIYGHEEVIHILQQNLVLLFPEKMTAFLGKKVHLVCVEDGETKMILVHLVTFFDIHSTKAKQFGFMMEYDGKRLTCLGDEPYRECEKQYVEKATWLMHEAFCLYSQKDIYHPYQKHHSTVKDACVIGNEMHVENLILYHSEDDNLLDRKRLYQEEGSFYQGHLYIPDDLEMIEI